MAIRLLALILLKAFRFSVSRIKHQYERYGNVLILSAQ